MIHNNFAPTDTSIEKEEKKHAHLDQKIIHPPPKLLLPFVFLTLVDQNVGIGRQARHHTGNVPVNLINLVTGLGGCQELAGGLSLRGQDNPVGAEDAHAGPGVVDGLDGVLHLVQTAFGVRGRERRVR